MQVRRTIWFGLASVAVASWLTAAASPDVRPPSVPAAPPRESALDRSAATLATEIERLHQRVGPTAAPEGRRDLFRFSSPRAPRRPVAAPADTPPPARMPSAAVAAPPAPALALIGVAEDAGPEGPVRTAIVSGLGDLFLVKAGDDIGSRFRVNAVSATSVDVFDTATNSTATLVLR